jgi:hypothetical protein
MGRGSPVMVACGRPEAQKRNAHSEADPRHFDNKQSLAQVAQGRGSGAGGPGAKEKRGSMHRQAERIVGFREQMVAAGGDYDVFKLGADLCLDLDFLHHHVYHVEPSDLTRVGRSRNWPHDPWS